MIDVKINSRYQGCLMLEDGLRRHYDLADACVVPALPGGTESERLGQAAAQYLMQRLRPGDLLAAGWGATVSNAIQRLGHVANERNVGLVSMTGGVGTYVDGMRAAHWGSNVHLVPAPLVVRDPAVATALSTEPAVTNLLEMALDASYQLVGIGELSQSSTVVRSGYVSPSEIEPFRRKGAVGDILCRFFDESGRVLNLPFHDRVIGVKLEALAKSQKVVAAAGGAGKVPAIRAALLGKFASILITDEDTGLVRSGQCAVLGGTFWQQIVNVPQDIVDPDMNLRLNPHVVPGLNQAEAISFFVGAAMRWFRDAFGQREMARAAETGIVVSM